MSQKMEDSVGFSELVETKKERYINKILADKKVAVMALKDIGKCESPIDMIETAKEALRILGYNITGFGEKE